MKTLLLIIILSIAAFGQIQAPKGFDVRYDKFKNTLHVSFSGYGVGVTEWIGFISKGETLTKDQDYFYISFDGNRCRGFCFESPQMILLIDGERVDLGKKEYHLSNSALFLVERSVFEKIAAAKLVEYQVGNFEGKWEAKTLAKFKTLLELGTAKK